MASGNRWLYIRSDDSADIIVKIISEREISGTKEYAGTFGDTAVPFFYITVAPNRITLTAMDLCTPNEVGVTGFLLFLLPLEEQRIGAEWIALTEPITWKAKVVAISDINVPAGHFKDCIKIEYTNYLIVIP